MAEAGVKVVLSGRRQDKLEEVAVGADLMHRSKY